MFNYLFYLNKFREDYKKGILSNNSVCGIDPSLEITNVFKIIGIHKLTPTENSGNHNLYIDVIDQTGAKIFPLIDWGWSGQKPSEIVQPLRLDKPLTEPSGNLVIWGNQTIWSRVKAYPSDEIQNVHTRLPDEGPGNTYGHHSYYVVWMQVTKVIEPEPTPDNCADLEIKYMHLQRSYDNLIEDLKGLVDLYE